MMPCGFLDKGKEDKPQCHELVNILKACPVIKQNTKRHIQYPKPSKESTYFHINYNALFCLLTTKSILEEFFSLLL